VRFWRRLLARVGLRDVGLGPVTPETHPCLAWPCTGESRRILREQIRDENWQRKAAGRVLASPYVMIYDLECGHSVACWTGDPAHD